MIFVALSWTLRTLLGTAVVLSIVFGYLTIEIEHLIDEM